MNERHTKALELRMTGKSYAHIGKVLGISIGRARQIVAIAERKIRLDQQGPDWAQDLPTKLMNALIAGGFNSKDEIRQALIDGVIGLYPDSVKGKVQGIGPKSIKELKGWAGLGG